MVNIIFTQMVNKQSLNKLFFIIVLFLFIVHPCFSATTQPTHSTKKVVTSIKKPKMTAQKKKLQAQKKTVTVQQKKTITKKKKLAQKKKPVMKKKKQVTQKKKTSVSTKKSTKTSVLNKSKKKAAAKKLVSKKIKKTNNRQTTSRSTSRTLAHQSRVKKPPTRLNTTNITKAHLPEYTLTSIEKTLVQAVRKTVSSVRYTAYKLGGTQIDPSRGIYVVDCSMYVDHVLKSVYPHAFTNLTSWSGSLKPTTSDYYQYFTNLNDTSQPHWNTIDDVLQLRPGDILVFRYKNKLGNDRGGHVMIVMDKPIQKRDAFLVRVADSAPTGHSTDTRMPHASGIGIGSLLLKVDPKTYQPYAYAWKIGSRWQKNVAFAMARPIHRVH